MAEVSMGEGSTNPPQKPAIAIKKASRRSRVGNGKTLVAGADPRSLVYREYQDEVADLCAHVGGAPTATQFDLIEEAADLKVSLRASRQARMMTGEATIPHVTACTMVNTLRRLLVDLGIEPKLKDITPALETYFASKRDAQDAEVADD